MRTCDTPESKYSSLSRKLSLPLFHISISSLSLFLSLSRSCASLFQTSLPISDLPTYLSISLSQSPSLHKNVLTLMNTVGALRLRAKEGQQGSFSLFNNHLFIPTLSPFLSLSFFLTQLLSLTILLIFLLLMIQKIKMYSQQSTSFTAL